MRSPIKMMAAGIVALACVACSAPIPTVTPAFVLTKDGERSVVGDLAQIQSEVPFTIVVPEVDGLAVTSIHAVTNSTLGPMATSVSIALRPPGEEVGINVAEGLLVSGPTPQQTAVDLGGGVGWIKEFDANGTAAVNLTMEACGLGFLLMAFPELGPGREDVIRVAEAIVEQC